MQRTNIILTSILLGVISSSVAAAPPSNKPKAMPVTTIGNSCQPEGTPKDDIIICTDADLTGIDSGGGNDNITINADAVVTKIAIDPKPLAIAVNAGDGNDVVTNNGAIVAEVTSLGNGLKSSPGNAAKKSKDGSTVDDGKTAIAIGIDGGTGADNITNTESVVAISTTVAGGISSGPFATDARALSVGINGGDGADTITNDGAITALADTAAVKGNIPTGGGLSTSNDSSTSAATSIGIDGGDGPDTVTNNSTISAISNSAIVTVGTPGDALRSSRNSGNSAEATATGISGGGGEDTIGNLGEINVTATAGTASVTVALSATGAATAESTSTAKSSATGIDTGEGGDTVTNDGSITSRATSISLGQGAAVSDSSSNPFPRTAWKGEVVAESSAVGIKTGAGVDDITNNGSITAGATSVTGTSTVSAAVTDVKAAESTATAKANAIGIDAGDGDDTITNSGTINAVATATAGALDLVLSQEGSAKAAHEGGPSADATATGISADGSEESTEAEIKPIILPHRLTLQTRLERVTASGNDTITNNNSVNAVASAVSGSAGGAVSISGAATSNMRAKANATATGINAGSGNDTVTNDGEITAVSTATAGAVGISFSESGKSNVKGGPEAEATAVGISADGGLDSGVIATTVDFSTQAIRTILTDTETAATGADTITNNENVTAVATATSGSQGGAISISGAATADTKSTSKATATALDAGAGDDTITNNGNLTAVSTATAAAVGISFSESGKSEVKGGPEAEATAIGISADGTQSDTLFQSSITVDLQEPGVRAGILYTSDAATGADSITNNDDVTAVATAISGGAAGAVTISGAASASTTAKAKATATAVDAGDGDDAVTNSGNLTAIATATAGAVGVSFSESKGSSAGAGAEAEAVAMGISGDGGPKSVLTQADIGIASDGVELGFRYENNAATGADTITNDSVITTVATALSGAGNGGISISGEASVDAESTATSRAVGIDAGAGGDTVTNNGALTAVSTATAGVLGIAVSESGEAKVEGGPKADATAIGISGDGTQGSTVVDLSLAVDGSGLRAGALYQNTAASGADTIDNSSAITTVATAISGTEGLAVSVKKAASTDVSSEATSAATAIEAGAGDDTVTNSGLLTTVATSLAGTVGGSISEGDKASADASATANSEAIGIAGDGGLHDSTIQATLDIDTVEGVNTTFGIEQVSAGGNDNITNTGVITAVSNAVAAAGSVALSVDKSASANAAATADSVAKAIDGGTGNDTINNSGVLTSVSTATAGEVAASISMKGNATGLKSIWQGGAEADATATGISGDSADKDLSSRFELDVDFVEEQVTAESHVSYVQAGGDDMITNDGVITATAVATTPSADIAIAAEDMAAAVSTSEARATAIAIDGGTGNDLITNNGVLVSSAVATAATANVAVSKKSSLAADSIWNGGTTAEAKAVGISGDGEGKDLAIDGIVAVSEDVVQVAGSVSSTTVGDDDDITNDGAVVVTSLAITPTANVAVSVKGAGAAISASEANASAAGIDAGAGNDIVVNDAALVVTSGATAIAANVAVSKSAAIAGNSIWDGGTKAEAEAVGISGDGDGRDFEAGAGILVTADAVQAGAGISSTVVTGDDDITNNASITATSIAAVQSLSVAVSAKGLSASVSEATATSTATGIDAGAGDDFVGNAGVITASSLATAAVANVAVTGSGVSAAWDGGTSAEANAVGISGDGEGRNYEAEVGILVTDDVTWLGSRASSTVVSGSDMIENDGVITATSVAIVPSVSVAVSAKGVSAAVSEATANARTAGIDAGAGDDQVTNSGVITTTSLANATAVNVAVTGAGVSAAWDGGTLAEAESVGISGDGEGRDYLAENSVTVTEDVVRLSARLESAEVSGNDRITNEGVITTTSIAATPSLAVAVTPSGGLSAAVTTAEAKSRAATIDAGSGDDIVDNSGVLTSSAVSLAGAVSVAVTGGGVSVAGNSVWDGGTRAEAEAIGIDGDGEGRDRVAAADMVVTEDGVVMSAELSDSDVSGNDDITNTGVITASSLASATSAGVSVTLSGGVSAAVSTSTADARAVGIDGGSGDDIIDNQGVITATAIGNANTLSVAYATAGVAVASDAVMDGGTTAEAEAIGIDGDGEGRDLSITGLVQTSDAGTIISGRIANETVAGNDDITNDSVITATAASLAPSVGVAVTPGGLSVALTTATANARSAGIDAGSGDDDVDNTGTLTATAVAVAVAVPVAVTPAGVAVAADAFWDGGTTAESEAVGISGDGVGTDFVSEASIGSSGGNIRVLARNSETVVSGDDTIINDGTVTATAAAEALSVAVSFTPAGLAVAASTSTANARSAAIDAGSGDDYIDNSGTLTSTSVANANSLSVAVTPAGLSVASGPVWDGGTHANAEAIGISGDGEGRDHVSEFIATVDESGTSVIASDSWTTVTGDDEIINSGNIVATAVAVAPSIGVAVTPAGVSVAVSTATAAAQAVAIDGGSGNDDIENSGDLVATAVANADALSVTVTPAGVTVSADSVWDGGTSAHSEAIGISGDGDGTDDTIEASITANSTGVGLYAANRSLVVNGDDTITNSGSIDAVAVSVVPSIGVAVTPAGLSVALSQATTTARAAAIDAGSGNDFVDNSEQLTATATSVSVAVPVAVTPAGVAIAADAVWDGGTSADAEAVGIAGDGAGTDFVDEFSIAVIDGEVGIYARDSETVVTGDDTIFNNADVTSTAVSVAASVGVSVTPAGVSASASTATANSRSAAIDAGAGADYVDNNGDLTSVATAVAVAVPVAVAPIGFGVALDAIWDGGTSATASATGIDADGEGTDFVNEATIRAGDDGTLLQTRNSSSVVGGDDTINNSGEIDASAVAVAPSVAFSLGVVGGVSAANATTEAYATAINAGAGDDQINNTGRLTATAVSNADAIAIAVGIVGVAGNAVLDGGTTAEAEAIGISGDGHGGSEVSEFTLASDGLENSLTLSETSSVATGEDGITNSGRIDAVATAVTPSLSESASGGGITLATSTALSRAASIDAGGASDVVVNEGHLNATATSVAVAVNQTFTASVGIAADAVWEGGTTAEAEAVGISGDGLGVNESTTRSITITDELISFAEHTSESQAFGNDEIENYGAIDADATAVAVSVGVATSIGGSVAASTSTARSNAAAINAGGGDDRVTNEGALTVDATSVAVAASVSMSALGVSASLDAVWDGGTTAESEAVGIDGDGVSGSVTTERSITVSADGIALVDETVRSSTDGDDNISNTATIDATALSNSTSVGVSAILAGVAASIATSTADSTASAIRSGAGDDEILNQGALTATSLADADGVAVSHIPTLGASISTDSFWDGGTTANAVSSGIDGGSGNDSITNESSVTANSVADAASTSVSFSVAGIAAAFAESTADAQATAIDGAAGDDTISNSGELTAMSTADAQGVSVSVGLVGFAAADSSAIADAESIGIDAGDGENTVDNSGNITAGAAATATGASVTVEIVGAGLSDRILEGETRAEATAAGMVGGDESDNFTNNADIMLGSTADISSTSVTVNLIGFSGGDASATANAMIIGMDGGDSADTLINNELIAGTAISTAPSRAVSVGLIGASNADASTEANASATGIQGGEGDDGVYNAGLIGLAADASGEATSVTVTLAGAAHADADTAANADATGMTGGDGTDEVFNFGGVGVTSTATADANGTSVQIIGVASQSASSTATATAVGLSGGSGDDSIANIGFLSSSSIANANMSNASWTLVGASSQQGLVTANALSYGMLGELGDDVLFNDGEVDVDVESALTAACSVTAVLGGGSGNTSLSGTLRGFGMAGGDGDDQILNANLVSVDSSLVSTSTGTAWTLIGMAGGSTGVNSDNALFGLSGGHGDDVIANTGILSIAARSVMTTISSSWTFTGVSAGASSLTSATRSTGVAGDNGADWMYNEGSVDVSAEAILKSTSVSFSFAGGASSGTSLTALAQSTGFDGGAGANQMFNGGSLLVDATATNLATGGAQTVVGDAGTVAATTGIADARGFAAGIGDDIAVNIGVIDVASFANPNSFSNVDVGGFFVDGISRSHANQVSNALGARFGAGANMFLNDGSLLVEAGGTGSATAESTGSGLSLTADAFADAISSTDASQARGIAAGDGANQVNNQGVIDVDTTIATNSTSTANGAGLIDGAGSAFAQADSSAVNSFGIDVGHGDNAVASAGEITVELSNGATANAVGRATGIDFFTTPNSNATAVSLADDAMAIGIDVGNGENSIWNGGSIAVTSAPNASATGEGLFNAGFDFAVDSFADSVSSANNARAFGIRAGDGANIISNAGTISAVSAPNAWATAVAKGKGWDGDADARASSTANFALAVGIFAGDGDNTVVNQGEIHALAMPMSMTFATGAPGGAELAGVVEDTVICSLSWRRFPFLGWLLKQTCEVIKEVADTIVDDGETVSGATARADDARAVGILLGDGDNVVVNQGAISATATPSANSSATAPSGSPPEVEAWETTSVDNAEAIGILTGGGNDIIVNEGSIETWVSAGAINRYGIAIRSGGGDDSVYLQDGSTLIGDVDLGDGNDSLNLLGITASTGNFYGGNDSDHLLVDGTSVLNGGAFGFERLRLFGTSNFTLSSLESVATMDIVDGTLNVNGSYMLAPTGQFNVNVNGDGSHGQLNVGGTASLDGDLRVTRSDGPYSAGTTFDIITASLVSGNFDNTSLPADTTLVSFSLDQGPTEVNVVANVIPFASMAKGASEAAVASYLDELVESSSGELATMLASMQAMPEDDFGEAFRSLNPGTFNTYQVTDRSMRDHLSGTHGRLAGMRASLAGGDGSVDSAFMADRDSLYLGAGSLDTRFADPQVGGEAAPRNLPVGAWTVGYISDTDSASVGSNLQSSGFTTAGFTTGMDHLLSDNLVVGVSFGAALSKMNNDGGFGEGELGSRLTSLYSTYLPSRNTYVDAVLSHSTNYISTQRNISIGDLRRGTASGHRSNLYSAFIETGRVVEHGRLRSEFFGSVYYSSMREDGFEEIGGGPINVIVDPRHFETVTSELGWRSMMQIMTRNGILTPKFNIAYLHDFDFGDESMSVRFAGAPDIAFSPASHDISGHGVRVGFGLNFADYRGWSLESQLGGEINGRRRSLGGALQIQRKF